MKKFNISCIIIFLLVGIVKAQNPAADAQRFKDSLKAVEDKPKVIFWNAFRNAASDGDSIAISQMTKFPFLTRGEEMDSITFIKEFKVINLFIDYMMDRKNEHKNPLIDSEPIVDAIDGRKSWFFKVEFNYLVFTLINDEYKLVGFDWED